MPKFSFVVPVYNCRQYIEECVESILKQTVSDFEILLIDDGSSDGSGELCNRLAGTDKRIRVFHKQNGGASNARNFGIKQAYGQYIFFIDGDDTIEKNCIETIEPFLNGDKCLVVFGMCFDYWNEERIVQTVTYSMAFPGSHSTGEISENLSEYFNDNVLSSACNKVFPAKLFSEYTHWFPENVSLYEDLTFVIGLLPCFENVQIINEGLYHYRNVLGKTHLSQRVANLSKIKTDLIPMNHAFAKFGEKTGYRKNASAVAASIYCMMLEQHLLNHSVDTKVMRKALPEYIHEESFQIFLKDGVNLDSDKQRLISMIEQGRFGSIRFMFSRKKLKRRCRSVVKRMLGR